MASQFTVRVVASLDCPSGAYARTERRTVGLNDLLRTVNDLDAEYGRMPGVRVVKTGFGPLDASGRHTSFRWAWESYGDDIRTSDALFVTAEW